jgi:hypothetical protein
LTPALIVDRTGLGAILKSSGHDISKFNRITYSHYADLVRKYRVVLRGYPITPEGHIVAVSNYPGGIPGLIHAEKHLESGAWGFEKIRDATYNDWDAECNEAKAKDQPAPLPPHIAVPGTEFVPETKKKAATGGGSKSKVSRKRSAVDDGANQKKKGQATSKTNGSKASHSTPKSREVIEDSDSEQDFTGEG